MRMSILIATIALAACGGTDPVADEANSVGLPSTADVADGDVGTASADGSAPANVLAPGGRAALTSGDTASKSERAVPRALHGRWGMTPADCTSTRGDAKGLLIVSADGLRFYESVAKPTRNVNSSEDSISADFDFTGEGQSWTKFETLQLQGGNLVRTESSPMSSFTYVRCR